MKQITSPGWMRETSAQDWCTGKTQKEGMGREVGGVTRMGNTCKSMVDSCQCMAKATKYIYIPSNYANIYQVLLHGLLYLKYSQCPCVTTDHRKALDRKALSRVCRSGRRKILKTQRLSENLRNDITAVGIFLFHQKESFGHKEHFV